MSGLKGVVAAGHGYTVQAAEQVLHEGGNAFDAILAAHFAACVAEPVLASLGGAGYLLAHRRHQQPVLYDFFVQTPKWKSPSPGADFRPIHADFGTTTQEFHIGAASIATPGVVKGVFQVYTDLCSMPMTELVAPAVEMARQGVVINDFQAYIFEVVKPILQASPEVDALYRSHVDVDRMLQPGEIQRQPAFADFLEVLAREGEALFYQGEVAQSIETLCLEREGHLRMADLQRYQVRKRQSLRFDHGAWSVYTNPPPASGGLLICFALQLLQRADLHEFDFGSREYLHLLAEVMHQTNKARLDFYLANTQTPPDLTMLEPQFLQQYRSQVYRRAQSLRGTTHISVVDAQGNSAGMTVSNGEGCGYLLPYTGVMLNNMLGEEDLNPGGFHRWQPDQRMASMMAPTLLLNAQGEVTVLGSGGSNRIRTAILQVLINLLEYGMNLQQAITAPRLHYEGGMLNLEPGFAAQAVRAIQAEFPDHKLWQDINLFFGGTHAVQQQDGEYRGVGDPRRGGVAKVCY